MLSKFLIKDGILLEPSINRKWHVLESLTRYFCRDYSERMTDRILEVVINREMIVSTGLGGGVAIPHARTNLISRTGIVFARYKKGIEWNSIDGSKVYFLFMVIGPESSAEEYLFVLSKISKLLSRRPTRADILKSDSPEEIYQIFEEAKDRSNPRAN